MRQAGQAAILMAVAAASGPLWRTATQGSQFLPGQKVGTIQHASINEASGLAASRANPGVLWVHNDSGDTARVFAMSVQGVHLGTYNLTGASAIDWEDMAIGPGPVAGQWYLFLGDVGDNGAVRFAIRVYRVPEPGVSLTQSAVTVNLSGVETITLQYPDGPRDAEALMVDPATRDLYIVSKRESRSRLYRAPYPQPTSETMVMEFRGELPWGWATGGDISPTGAEILVRGYLNASLWRRPAGTALWEALLGTADSEPLAAEPQGEAICFAASGAGYYTVSEGSYQPVYFFERARETGNFDGDADADLADFTLLQGCFNGPNRPPQQANCGDADLDWDGDVDLADFGVFQGCFNGPNRPPACSGP
jgi:hypothetical protein